MEIRTNSVSMLCVCGRNGGAEEHTLAIVMNGKLSAESIKVEKRGSRLKSLFLSQIINMSINNCVSESSLRWHIQTTHSKRMKAKKFKNKNPLFSITNEILGKRKQMKNIDTLYEVLRFCSDIGRKESPHGNDIQWVMTSINVNVFCFDFWIRIDCKQSFCFYFSIGRISTALISI